MHTNPIEYFPLDGTKGNDILFLTLAGFQANEFDHADAHAYGGDDVVVRDKSGGYTPGDLSHIYGGSGFDIVTYIGAFFGLTANLGQNVGSVGAFSADTFDSVEGLVGTTLGDHMIGSSGGNRLWGHDGNDALWGEGGNDTVYGGQGADTIRGGSGVDQLHGDQGADLIEGARASTCCAAGTRPTG